MVVENSLIAHLAYSEHAQCELSADLALVPEVAGKVRAYCARNGLDALTGASIELALVEGINNAIEHGCRGMDDCRIRVGWKWSGEILEIEILDPGQFRPAPALAHLPDPLSEGGRGTFVMSALMDSVNHEIRDGRHLLVLRKRLGLPKPRDTDAEIALGGMVGELSNSYETISALFRFGEYLATARSFEDFFEQVRRRLLKLVSGDDAWLRLGDRRGRLKLVTSGRMPHNSGLPALLLPEDESVETQVFRESEQQTVEDCSELKPHDPLRRDRGSAFVCPILFRDTTVGVLSVVREQINPYFSAGETRLMGAVADFLGIARTMAVAQEQRQTQERTERELEIAAEMQRSLLPNAFPETSKFRIFGVSHAAHEVGGDYFDVLPIGDDGVLLVIADVMGKGMPAAWLATILRTAIRAHAGIAEEPGRLLTVVNRQLGPDLNNLGMFITAQIVFLSDRTDDVVFASAGHCPLLKLSHRDTHASQSSEGGVPLGVLDEVEYESMHERIAAGDRFILLTDGVYEVHSPSGEVLWLDPLAQMIPSLCTGDPRNSCKRLLEYVASYSDGAPASDDRTLLIAQHL